MLSDQPAPLAFTVEQNGGKDFLTLVTTSGTGQPVRSGNSVVPHRLRGPCPGNLRSRLAVKSVDAANSPQDFVIVLNVSPPSAPAFPNPTPAGLVLLATGKARITDEVQVFTSSAAAIPFQVSTSTETGGDWLSITPVSGTVSAAAPARITVIADSGTLQPGVYRGAVSISQSNIFVRTVNVTLIVTPAPAPPPAGVRAATAGCAPAKLVITHTGLTTNFSSPAGWPRTLAVRLFDDCGNPVSNGSVAANFSNGDIPVSLRLTDPASSTYSTTWVPRGSLPQITVTVNATAPPLPAATAAVVGGVVPNVSPVLARNGILHNLYPVSGAGLAPGTIVSIYGSALAAGTVVSDTLPLPSTLEGTSVLVGGVEAPLFFVSPGQINAQIPFQLVPGHEYPVIVTANDALTTPEQIQMTPLSPGVARLSDGRAIAQHADFTLIDSRSPAKPGEYVVIYLAGMGSTDNPVRAGDQAPVSPLASVNAVPSVKLGGKPVSLAFAGLTPGLIGVYQINFQVPEDAASGDLSLEVSQSGVSSNVSSLPVSK